MLKREKPKLSRLTEGQQTRRWVVDRDSLFIEMKKALMNRDPLVRDYLKELSSYDFKKDRPQKETLEKRRQKLQSKWNVNILNKVFNLLSSPIISFEQKELNRFPPGELVISNRTKGYPVSSLPPQYLTSMDWLDDSEDVVNIQVDLRLINLNSARLIKDAVWEIVKEHLKEGKKGIPRGPKELNFLYHCRPETVNNYLKWYDLHIQEKLGFRPIAAWDNTKKTNPQRAEQVLERLIHYKNKCHGHIPGEDKIEKGVKTIYLAIHRTQYSRKTIEPVFEQYNCSLHSRSCPPSCTYYQEWVDRFDRLNPIW